METSGTREKKYSCIWYLNIWSHFAINLQYTIEINSKPNKTIETQKKTIDDQSIRRPQKNQVGQTLNKKNNWSRWISKTAETNRKWPIGAKCLFVLRPIGEQWNKQRIKIIIIIIIINHYIQLVHIYVLTCTKK